MDFTNMIFVVLLVFVVLSGAAVFMGDVAQRYPQFQTTGQNFSYVNDTLSSMNVVVNQSSTDAMNFQQNQDLFSAFAGYLTTAYSALTTMFTIPGILMNVFSNMAANTAPWIPVYIISAINVAIMGMFLIGILYFLLKVK